jgi:5-methylcytosine-specific restriction protein A
VNRDKKFVVFGAWEHLVEAGASLILNDEWRIQRGRKQPGYAQAREHLRLVQESGYRLMTFPIIIDEDQDEGSPAKIKEFIRKLTHKSLKRVGTKWFALDESHAPLLPEEVSKPESYFEGASKAVSVNSYERNPIARAKCIAHHGFKCASCDFDFSERYGDLGEHYIHVHHRIPLGEIKKEYKLDPIKDLVPICPNCHAMIHRTQPALTVEELQKHLRSVQEKS